MALNFQYNKTSKQKLEKDLKVRERALPTIKSKESALRMEVKKAKGEAKRLDDKLQNKINEYGDMNAIWGEFDTSLVRVKDVEMSVKKLAGVKTPVLEKVIFEIAEFSLFSKPAWFLKGINLIQELAEIGIEREFFFRKKELLERARKKTTQKVNLFEKVQIPGYHEAILKIKRFMEDEENLNKAAQKIVKSRQEKKAAEA